LGASFPHDGYHAELTALRDQLKAGLSGGTPEPGAAPLPPVSELAERIKALKNARTIEAAPQRSGNRRTSTAEQPVTMRIRRQIDEPMAEPLTPAAQVETVPSPLPVAAPLSAPVPTHAPEILHPAATASVHPLAQPKPVYQERVERNREQKAKQLSLF
jgi:hypothetical protein